jgi:hypothetical protein
MPGSRVRVPPLLSSEASHLSRVAGLSSCTFSPSRFSVATRLATVRGHFSASRCWAIRSHRSRSSASGLNRPLAWARSADLTTAAGRAQLLEEERRIEQLIEAGFFANKETIGQLGGFASVQELQQSIRSTADAINALGDAASQTSRALQNVPDLLTLTEFEFQVRQRSGLAGIPGGTDGAALPLPGEAPPGTAFLPPRTGTLGVDTGKSSAEETPLITSTHDLSGGASLMDLLEAVRSNGTGTGPRGTFGNNAPITTPHYGDVHIHVNVEGSTDPAAIFRAAEDYSTRVRTNQGKPYGSTGRLGF